MDINKRAELMRQMISTSSSMIKEEDRIFAEHWANDLISTPHALISVIETKIARAEIAAEKRTVERILSLRKQIINCVINYGLTPEVYERVMSDLEALIKGEQK